MDELLVDAALVRLVRRSLSLVIKLSSHPTLRTKPVWNSHRSQEYFLRVPSRSSCCPLSQEAMLLGERGTWASIPAFFSRSTKKLRGLNIRAALERGQSTIHEKCKESVP